jgi:hypothetical protein
MSKITKFSIVIHTEEEFDWSGGFKASNNQVTHERELFSMCENMIKLGCKITCALDYAFVDSTQGKWFIESMLSKHPQSVEFATHLHPWVNPPFANDYDKFIDEQASYPGNLPEALEREKLLVLTEKIHAATGILPTAYLAGRYGVGPNTYKILNDLGYKIDVSVTPFTDYTAQSGPNFFSYNNQSFIKESILCIPHSTGYISYVSAFSDWLNKDYTNLPRLNRSILGKVILKLLGVEKVRLSPEQYTAMQMKKLINSLERIGIEHLIYSFHSSSAMLGGSPYSETQNKHDDLLLQNLMAIENARKKGVHFSFLEEKNV